MIVFPNCKINLGLNILRKRMMVTMIWKLYFTPSIV